MIPNKPTLLLLTVLTFAAGCKPSDKETTQQEFDKAKQETKTATQDMKDYTYAQKTEFVATMQSEITALNQDLDQLAAKIDKSSDAVKAEAKPKLQALRDQTAELNKQLDAAKNATESTWGSVQNGFVKAYDASKAGFQEARQWVSDKIAP